MTSPALSPRKQRLVEAFRAVLRESTGYPDADEAGRASLYASIGGDPDLLAVWREETAPAQAALDLHLTGEGHAGRRVFEQTGRVEDAAGLLGSTSLDATAALIGHRWQPRKAG
jgi:hypothetical protein